MSRKRLPIARPNTLPALELEAARGAAESYAKGSRAASTWRAYESDWRMFLAWCRAVGRVSLPAEPATVALFLAAQAKLGIAPSTLGRRLAAIRLMHVGARLASPHDAIQVDEVMHCQPARNSDQLSASNFDQGRTDILKALWHRISFYGWKRRGLPR